MRGAWFVTKELCKIRLTNLTTVTAITLSQTEVPSSPGWHMKDNGHPFFLLIFSLKINLCSALVLIRIDFYVL